MLYGISIMIYGIIGIRLKEEGLDIKNFYTITVLPVFLFYRKLTVLLFKDKIEPNKIKNFYSMKTCLDLNNTVDSGIYYLEDNLKRYKSKIFLPLRLALI